MSVNLFYGPENPRIDCELQFRIEFKKLHANDLWEGQVHYDILIIDDNTAVIASAAADEGRGAFFSTSGQTDRFWLMQGEPGLQTFAIFVYGTGPEFSDPALSGKAGFFTFDIELLPSKSAPKPAVIPPPKPAVIPPPQTSIPDWIKNNAGWWADGQIDDSSFVSGIQWLISNNVMTIPSTEQTGENQSNAIPDWIKNNAGWWATGQIPDSAFVSGLQWLITNGIMTIS